MTHFDLVIIGSGSGNSIVTPELDGWRIALVEESTFGGTCLNVGCIPTKMFVLPADLADDAAHADRLGLTPAVLQPDWPAISGRVFGRIDPISAGGRDYRATGSPNVTLYEAHAEFLDPADGDSADLDSADRGSADPASRADGWTLQLSVGGVATERITAGQVVLATGSRPVIPGVVTRSGVPFETSETIMRRESLPQRMIVLGGGFIAAEFAHIASAFGVHTTVLSRSGLLRHEDRDVSARFTELVRQKFHLRSGVRVDAISQSGAGESPTIHVKLDDGSVVEGDLLLVATGRTPNSDRLGLDAVGVPRHPDGRVMVDEFQRTPVAGIWALGDVCSERMLKHVANHETRVVAHNLAHPEELVAADHRFVPSAVFTHPQIASVGLTEQDAEKRAAEGRGRFVVHTQDYGSTAYGWALEDTTSFCKLLADPDTGLLLGAHLLGPQASTLIQPLIQAMSFGLGVKDLARGQYWIHPALPEVIENALLGLGLA